MPNTAVEPGGSHPPLIQLRHVVKEYDSPAGPFPALKGVSLSVARGEFIGVIGKSGAGKSTLLNMITGIDQATSGEVVLTPNGRSYAFHTMPEAELAVFRGQHIGVVHQAFHFLPMLTLLENIMLPIDLCGDYSRRESAGRAMELLRLVELEEHAGKKPAQISGGQQQRVAIARALANDPELLVADEPTGSLDTVTADHILEAFTRLVAQGKTIVMVTHDSSLAPLFSRQVQLTDGVLTQSLGEHGGNGRGGRTA
ncbi:MAG: ABC transporter ATP-binding protein [Anaerolineales bacterium]|nr:ABC transporter ATP-binding protein [Anaerolineales bacterium]